MKIEDVVIVGGARTPMGKFGGTLKDMPAYELGAAAIRAALARSGVSPEAVDDVVLGHCRQAGNFVNPAHSAAAFAGIPSSIPSISLNMACPAGMRSVAIAAQEIRLGEAGIVVAGGFDSMSSIPWLLKGVRFDGLKMGPKTLEDGWSDSNDPVNNMMGMGETAENVADKHGISRAEMDAFAALSHAKAAAAQDKGWFEAEIAPVEVPGPKGAKTTFSADESVRRDTSAEKMAKLPAVFRKGGKVTAGNACGMTDGAVGLVVTSREKAKALGLKPLFSILAMSQAAVDGKTMGEGPGVSIPMALQSCGMKLSDMDAVEINEAFAAQVLANVKVLGVDQSKLNMHGGAIALGHPTGISGARIMWTLYNVLKIHGLGQGIASICGGGGVTMACVIRRED